MSRFIDVIENTPGRGYVCVADELDAEMKKCIEATLEHKKVSVVTVQIKVACNGTMSKALTMSAEISTKVPKEKRPEGYVFTNDESEVLIQPQEQIPMRFESTGKPGIHQLKEAK